MPAAENTVLKWTKFGLVVILILHTHRDMDNCHQCCYHFQMPIPGGHLEKKWFICSDYHSISVKSRGTSVVKHDKNCKSFVCIFEKIGKFW